MNVRSQRLPRILSRILLVLLALCVIGLIVLLPAMMFAYVAPGALPAELSTKVNGIAVDVRQPMIAGTLLLYANVALAAMTAIVVALRRIIRTVVAGEPFDVRNVGRLRLIAWAMAAMVVFEALGNLLAPPAVRAQLGLDNGGFNFGMFLGMLVILVLAEVFREGARLREENAGTI